MRHRVASKQFNRDTNARKALIKGLLRALVEQGEIVTTTSRAKEIKRLMDKLVAKAKTDSVQTRRVLHRMFGERAVVNTLVDRIAPAMADRVSGFTTISVASIRRGDSADQSRLKFVVEIDRAGSLKSGKDYSEVKPTKVAKVAKPVVKKEVKKTAKKVSTKKVDKK